MAPRKDGPMLIQQRAGNADFDTTQAYIREAESIRGSVEEPFPLFPACLLKCRRHRPGEAHAVDGRAGGICRSFCRNVVKCP